MKTLILLRKTFGWIVGFLFVANALWAAGKLILMHVDLGHWWMLVLLVLGGLALPVSLAVSVAMAVDGAALPLIWWGWILLAVPGVWFARLVGWGRTRKT